MSTLEEFATNFIGALADDTFTSRGHLLKYLQLPDEERSGDEAEVVDMLVTSRLLAALGYADSERRYNRHNEGNRPDFAVRIPEYPIRPCFVVEDKSTVETALSRHRQQLQNYLNSTHAPRGLLVNGRTILGYDNDTREMVLTLSVPLVHLVGRWLGEGDLFSNGSTGFGSLTQDERRILSVLYTRYARTSFAGLQALIDDLTLQRSEQVDHEPVPHTTDGSTWVAGRTRVPLVSAAQDPHALTSTVRDLIVDLEADVAVQFSAFRARYDEFVARTAQLPNTDTPYETRVGQFVNSILNFIPAARASQAERDALSQRLRLVFTNQAPQREIQSIRADIYAALGLAGTGTAILPSLDRELAEAAQWAQRYRAHVQHLGTGYTDALSVQQDYEQWRRQTAMLVAQTSDEEKLQREFFAQTAYVVITRMLLVRIIEDKRLMPRMFTNGGAAVWFRTVEPHYFAHAIGHSTDQLLSIAFQSAQQTYAHFYGGGSVFDWYRPDRNMIVRVLHALAGFDLKEINHDIVGAVYNGYVESEHKHESGLYYTPPAVIEYILDRIGYTGRRPLEGRLLDMSCGSGAFLVAAGRRLLAAHREYWAEQGHADVPIDAIDGVIRSYREALYGIDINPFACALAELNLLIQVLDLIGRARQEGLAVQIDTFQVFNEDALMVGPETRAVLSGSLPFPAEELPIPDQLKTGIGQFAGKFLFVVGNPPYVRADEGLAGLGEYRAAIKDQHPLPQMQRVLIKKWDLYVPFVAIGASLLAPNGRLGMIVSSAIENVPYASELRKYLASDKTIDEVSFFPHVRIFEDAAVENCILFLGAASPSDSHSVLRRWHDAAPPAVYNEQRLPQLAYGEHVFRQRLQSLRVRPSVPTVSLSDICYITKGMVLHANERHFRNQFALDDLLSNVRDASHPAAYVGSEDVDVYGIRRVRYLEYGQGLRAPERVSRPTFPELYDREKLLVGEFGGFALDDGAWDTAGFLTCNHSVFLLVPWHALAGVQNRSITGEIGTRTRADLESTSARIQLPYLLALLNSRVYSELLRAQERSAIRGRLQPDDLRGLTIPVPDSATIAAVVNRAIDSVGVARRIFQLRRDGWEIEADSVRAPVELVQTPTAPLSTARVLWGMTLGAEAGDVTQLRRVGRTLSRGRHSVISLPDTVSERAVEWLMRQFGSLPSGTTLASAVAADLEFPRTPADGERALDQLEAFEREGAELQARLMLAKDETETALRDLFEAIDHPPVITHRTPATRRR